MQDLKKNFAVLMTFVIIGTTAITGIFSASAVDFDDVSSSFTYLEQIDMLSDIGIIKGTSENEFSPDEKVTREQMALLLYRLMTGNDNSGRVNTSPFTDLYEPEYNGAISWAYANGFIFGTGNNTFDPKGGITLRDALAMVTRALGQTNDKSNAAYPWSYIGIGERLGLTEDIGGVSYTDTLTRAETAALLYNALTADYVVTKNVSGSQVASTTTILRYVYGYEAGAAFITATNRYALPGSATVVKNGLASVSIIGEDGSTVNTFVNASELELSNDIDSHLGEGVRVFYRLNDRTGIASILGASTAGMSKTVSSFSYDSAKDLIKIDGVGYKVVENYSNSVSTNLNELTVFAYNGTSTLTQVRTGAELAALDGFFSLKLIFDGSSSIASRAIIMPLSYAELDISSLGSINIAGGLKESELSGGFVNTASAKDGDIVLYHYDSNASRLVIAEKAELVYSVTLGRLTTTSAKFGEKVYELGVSGTGFDASAIYASLTVGEKYDLTVFGNRIIKAEPTSGSTAFSSTYLIALSTATPVVHNDNVCYFMKASIGGVSTNVYVKNGSVSVGDIYRYEADENGILSLISANETGFINRDEIKTVVDHASGMTIDRNGRVNYTLSQGSISVDFVTDADTVIAVGTANGIVYKTGAYASTITVNDASKVVAIMKDNVGSVETLKYLYISSGSLGNALDTSSYVKVLSNIALEYVNGNVMTAYKVFDLTSGSVKTLYSANTSLENGKIYILDEAGHITANEKTLESGSVTGYTGNIVTIGSSTYRLAENAIICTLVSGANGEFTVRNLSLSEIYGNTVSFITSGGEITRIIQE